MDGELRRVETVGVEQTRSYCAGMVGHMALAGMAMLEVTGPDKADRRARHGDPLDAVAAAQAALEAISGRAAVAEP